MKKHLLLAFILTSSWSIASTHRVIKIHGPGTFGENYSLFMNNGKIFELDKSNKANIEILRSSIKENVDVELELSTNISKKNSRPLIIKAIKIKKEISSTPLATRNKEYFSRDRYHRLYLRSSDPLSNYDLTTYRTYEIAQEVMEVFNGDTHIDSQCYARAHMWTYEAFLEYGDNLGKVWIFFSDKYIREFDHDWWFHVAPYAHIKDYSTPMVLDRGFTKIPYQLENWKNIFIKNEASCRRIYDYSEYPKNTEKEYCFLMFSSAYYWQPRDLEALGKNTRKFRWGYVLEDLDWSYNDALGTEGVRAPYYRDREDHNAYRY